MGVSLLSSLFLVSFRLAAGKMGVSLVSHSLEAANVDREKATTNLSAAWPAISGFAKVPCSECVEECWMPWKPRFSLRILLLLVALAAKTTFVSLNGRQWHQWFLDWSSTRTIQARAERVFRDETGKAPPAELVHILGSGDLSHWAGVYDIGVTGEQIISCGHDRAVRCWSIDTGECLQVISRVNGHIAEKSTLLVAIGYDKQVQVYDTSTSPLKLLRRFSIANQSAIRKAFCSPFEPILAVIYGNHPDEIQFFKLNDGTRLPPLRLGDEAHEVCLGFGGGGRLLAACKDELLLFNITKGDVVTTWKDNSWPLDRQDVRNVVQLSVPWWLVVGASTAIVWNEQTHDWKEVELGIGGTPEIVVPESSGEAWIADSGIMLRVSMSNNELSKWIVRTTPVMPVTSMAICNSSAGGQILTRRAVAYGPGQVGLLDEYGRLRLPREELDHITAAAWNYDGGMLATGTSAGEIIVMQPGTWTELRRFRAHGGAVEYIEFSPDGLSLLAEEMHEIAVFDWNTAKALVRKSRQGSGSRDTTLSSGNGRLLAWVLNEGWTLTDYAKNTLIARSNPYAPRPSMFSPRGPVWSAAEQCFVFVSEIGFCRLKLVGEGSDPGPSLNVTELPNSDLRYVRDLSVDALQALFVHHSTEGSRLRVWNWQSSVADTIAAEPFVGVPFATFTPSGREVAFLYQGDLLIYDQGGKQLYRQSIGPVHLSRSAIQFSPDGRYIAIVNGNGTCYVLRNLMN